jgi:hypothetical protein
MSCSRMFLVLALLAAPAAADPASWSKATMTAAPTYFPANSTVMVVGVGASARPVAAELVAALQASDAFELVSDGRALGNVDDLADDAIVKRVFARPIQRVAIVRVFPAGASVKAVVTVYAAQGEVTTAFTLAPGKTLVENPTPREAAGGVARDEMQSVVTTTGGTTTDASSSSGDGEVTYQRQQLVGMTGYGGVVTLENVSFFKNGRLLNDTPSLYDALGMTEKAAEYRDRDAAHQRWASRGGVMCSLGLTGVLGFGLWAVIAGAETNYETGQPANDTTLPWALTLGSAGLMVAGIVLWVENPAPANLTADEAVSLVDAHNAKRHHTTAQLHLTPAASPTSAGLTLVGSF